MKPHFKYPIMGATAAFAMAMTYAGYKSYEAHTTREIASFQAKAQVSAVIPHFSSLEQTVRHIVKNQLEQVEYAGTLVKEDIDLFKDKKYVERFYIVNDREQVKVEPVNKDEISHLIGKEIVLTGWSERYSNKIVGHIGSDPSSVTHNRQVALNHLDIKAQRYERMLLLWVDFSDSTPIPEGPEWASLSNIGDFLNGYAFQSYFNDVYQNRLKNKITKVVPYKFKSRTCADKTLGGYPTALGYIDGQDVQNIFTELNLNVKDYENVSVLANCNGPAAWGIGSGALVDGKWVTTSMLTMWPTYYKFGSPKDLVPYLPIPEDSWTFLDGFIHERGHTLGHPHANALNCEKNKLLFPCKHLEYGNPFDVMGSRNPSFYLNADHMKRQKVRPENQFLTIEKPGIYSIDNLESSLPSPIVAAYIKIPEIPERVFMVEHRQPVSYDRNLIKPTYREASRGLQLYSSINPWGSSPSFSEYEFRLVDPYPDGVSEEAFFHKIKNRSIVPEKPYFDPLTGVKITVLERFAQAKKLVNQRSITFKVEFDEKKRMCFHAKIHDVVEPLHFVVNNRDLASEAVPKLVPGDILGIKTKIHQGDPLVCPRFNVRMYIENTSMITSWKIPKGESPGFPPNPEFKNAVSRPAPTGGNFGGEIGGEFGGEIGGDDGGYDPTTPTIEYITQNVEMDLTLTGNLRVPTDAKSGIYELPVSYSIPTTGETFESTLKFQIVNEPIKASSPIKIRTR